MTIHIFDIATGKDITKEFIADYEAGNASLKVGHDGNVHFIRNGKDITSNVIFGMDNE